MSQKVWKNSKHESVGSDGTVYYMDAPCEIRSENGRIEIRFEDTDGDMVEYAGNEVEAGPFEVHGRKVHSGDKVGRATLCVRTVKDARFLEGNWEEGICKGEWFITLA